MYFFDYISVQRRSYEEMNIIRVKDYREMSDKAAEIIADRMKQKPNLVLGLATGSTPEGMYERLIEKYKAGEISFKDVTTFNLDEYVGLEKDHPQSYAYFMDEKLLDHVDIDKANTHIPTGIVADIEKECKEYDEMIKKAGNVDIQVLGIGVNGHIGFNEPGTPFDSRTHQVELSESTRQANARFFGSMDEVPTHAVTMGVGTILESKEILMIISGEGKAEALRKLVEDKPDTQIPSSALQNHDNVTIIADEAALSKLSK